MEPEFITYQKFDDPALAEELIELLEAHGVEYSVQEQTTGFDPSLAMGNATVDYAVKIKDENFQKVNQLLAEAEEKNVGEIDKDYYLFSFTNDELTDVLIKADEWSAFDVVLARKILAERGEAVNDNDIEKINKKRIEELKAVKPLDSWWLFTSYLLAFGIVGFFIGWYLATAKKTLPDGERIYSFIEKDRKHGLGILGIAALSFILTILYRFEIISQ